MVNWCSKLKLHTPALETSVTLGPLVLWGATATALKERGWAAEPPREMSDANSNTDVTSVSTDDPRGPFDVEMEVPWSANETGWNAVFAARDGQILRFDLGRTAVSRWGMCSSTLEDARIYWTLSTYLYIGCRQQGTNMTDLYWDATNALFTGPRMKRFRFCLCFSEWMAYVSRRPRCNKQIPGKSGMAAENRRATRKKNALRPPCIVSWFSSICDTSWILLAFVQAMLPMPKACPVMDFGLDRLGYLGVGLALQ